MYKITSHMHFESQWHISYSSFRSFSKPRKLLDHVRIIRLLVVLLLKAFNVFLKTNNIIIHCDTKKYLKKTSFKIPVNR